MIQLPGSPALSDFRIRKLLNALLDLMPESNGIELSAKYVHFVDVVDKGDHGIS